MRLRLRLRLHELEREALGLLILVVPECWSEGAVREQRKGMIQSVVLLEFRKSNCTCRGECIEVVLVQIEE